MKMKIRKLIPLAILAVVAVVALSSCDAMLDAIFSKNQITVDVQVATSSYPVNYDYYNGYGAYVTATITDSSGKTASQNTYYYSSANSSTIDYNFTFPNLSDGTYTISSTYYSYYNGGTYYSASTSTSVAGSQKVTVYSYP